MVGVGGFKERERRMERKEKCESFFSFFNIFRRSNINFSLISLSLSHPSPPRKEPKKRQRNNKLTGLSDLIALLSSALALAAVEQATSCTPGMDWK